MALNKNFLDKVNSTTDIKAIDAYNEIVDKLMIKKLKGILKTNNHLLGYDSEILFGNKIYPTCIYIFTYKAKYPTKYSYNGKEVLFYDNMPIVLTTKFGNGVIRGINLNFCNKSLRALVLNLIYNLDPEFFERNAELMVTNKTLPLSLKILSFFGKPDAEQILISFLKQHFNDVDYSFIFRTYSVENISNIRLIEPWQMIYLPFLEFNDIKGDSLKAILKIAGIDKIKC